MDLFVFDARENARSSSVLIVYSTAVGCKLPKQNKMSYPKIDPVPYSIKVDGFIVFVWVCVRDPSHKIFTQNIKIPYVYVNAPLGNPWTKISIPVRTHLIIFRLLNITYSEFIRVSFEATLFFLF